MRLAWPSFCHIHTHIIQYRPTACDAALVNENARETEKRWQLSRKGLEVDHGTSFIGLSWDAHQSRRSGLVIVRPCPCQAGLAGYYGTEQ